MGARGGWGADGQAAASATLRPHWLWPRAASTADARSPDSCRTIAVLHLGLTFILQVLAGGGGAKIL